MLLHPLLNLKPADDYWYFVVTVYGLLGTLVGRWLYRPDFGSPWWLFLASRATIFVGLFSSVTPENSWLHVGISNADLLYLVAYLFFIASICAFIQQRGLLHSKRGLIDGLIVFLGLATLAWQFLVLPTLVNEPVPTPLTAMVRMFYPLTSFAVLGLLVWLSTDSGAESTALRFLIAGSICYAVGESAFHLTAMSQGVPQPWILMLWLLAYVLWGAAAMHPSMASLSQPVAVGRVAEMSRARVNLVALAAFALPVVLLVQFVPDGRYEYVGPVIASVIISLLIRIRVRSLITQIERHARSMRTQALTDHLTGLPNRRHFELLYQQRNQRAPAGLALLLIDLDRFKSVNDAYGHPIGDRLLQAASLRLQQQLAPKAALCRLGRDEFAVLTYDHTNASALAQAWRLQTCFVEPFDLGLTPPSEADQRPIRVSVSASIGTAVAPGDGATLDDLSISTDVAMRLAKLRLTQVEAFRADNAASKRSDAELLAEFAVAIRESQLTAHFQPKVDLRLGCVVGLEALIRWQHPTRGLMSPGAFIATIEKTELIRDLTRWMLERSISTCAAWHASGHRLSVAVNISTRNLLDDRLCGEISQLLSRYHLPAELLELEITESTAMTESQRAVTALLAIRALGVKLSVDDYGTGFGSISYLEQLPVHVVKLDGRFVKDLSYNKSHQLIVRSTVELARELGLQVLAEGVEDGETLQLLKRYSCYLAQGYHISVPVAAEAVLEVVAQVNRKLGETPSQLSRDTIVENLSE